MALRGRGRDCRSDITKRELQIYWQLLTDPCFDSRVKIYFDIDMDGRINETDIKRTILQSCSTNKVSLNTRASTGICCLSH
ncbi:conserved hypothetical protein [Ricinus communis]|uniref:EF-hand domain-containing protein n=1 Tax=Ricinus communis TaxID=3988 RepID=B9T7D0_RICCO|nr:conserved hypothetical protein [Ricinus communis]